MSVLKTLQFQQSYDEEDRSDSHNTEEQVEQEQKEKHQQKQFNTAQVPKEGKSNKYFENGENNHMAVETIEVNAVFIFRIQFLENEMLSVSLPT